MNIKKFLVMVSTLLAGCVTQTSTTAPQNSALAGINTIVVIYAENHSFDNMYGLFPAANGIAQAMPIQKTQLDHDGKPLPQLPPVYTNGKPDPLLDRKSVV